MKTCFCTPIPSGRISENGRMELRAAAQAECQVRLTVAQSGKTIRECGPYPVPGALKECRISPDLTGILGQIRVKVAFEKDGKALDTEEFPYEIVSSKVHSTCLLDGCWVSIYHWSNAEARYFNPGLRKLTDDGWRQQVRSMHKIGITSILIQNVFDSMYYAYQHDMTADKYDGKAFYPSKLYPARMEGLAVNDPIEAILSEADKCDMAVFPGVGLYAWFDFSPESLEWHKRVTKELFERYGHHKSFYGWYLSEEMMGDLYYGYDPVPDEKYKDIAPFFAEYKRYVSELTPTKPVAMAPDNVKMQVYREQWLPILKNIDILIPFAFARTENNVAEIARLCAETGTHFWVDMEIFANPFDNGLAPKTYEDLIKEIHSYDVLEQVYGYQYTGLMNEPGCRMNLGGPQTEELYVKYQEYEKRIRNLK